MTRARRSRSASAWRAIDRFIESGSTYILDFDAVDLNTPAQRGTVDHQLQALIEMLAVGQQVVQIALPMIERSDVCATWPIADT